MPCRYDEIFAGGRPGGAAQQLVLRNVTMVLPDEEVLWWAQWMRTAASSEVIRLAGFHWLTIVLQRDMQSTVPSNGVVSAVMYS